MSRHRPGAFGLAGSGGGPAVAPLGTETDRHVSTGSGCHPSAAARTLGRPLSLRQPLSPRCQRALCWLLPGAQPRHGQGAHSGLGAWDGGPGEQPCPRHPCPCRGGTPVASWCPRPPDSHCLLGGCSPAARTPHCTPARDAGASGEGHAPGGRVGSVTPCLVALGWWPGPLCVWRELPGRGGSRCWDGAGKSRLSRLSHGSSRRPAGTAPAAWQPGPLPARTRGWGCPWSVTPCGPRCPWPLCPCLGGCFILPGSSPALVSTAPGAVTPCRAAQCGVGDVVPGRRVLPLRGTGCGTLAFG